MVDNAVYMKKVQDEADRILPDLKKVKDEIGRNPELGSEEDKSSELLARAWSTVKGISMAWPSAKNSGMVSRPFFFSPGLTVKPATVIGSFNIIR